MRTLLRVVIISCKRFRFDHTSAMASGEPRDRIQHSGDKACSMHMCDIRARRSDSGRPSLPWRGQQGMVESPAFSLRPKPVSRGFSGRADSQAHGLLNIHWNFGCHWAKTLQSMHYTFINVQKCMCIPTIHAQEECFFIYDSYILPFFHFSNPDGVHKNPQAVYSQGTK